MYGNRDAQLQHIGFKKKTIRQAFSKEVLSKAEASYNSQRSKIGKSAG